MEWLFVCKNTLPHWLKIKTNTIYTSGKLCLLGHAISSHKIFHFVYMSNHISYISLFFRIISLSLCNIRVSQWQCNVWFFQWQWSNPDGYWVKLANAKSEKNRTICKLCAIFLDALHSAGKNDDVMTEKYLHDDNEIITLYLYSTRGIPVSIKHAYIELGFISSDTRILMYHTWNITEDKVK